MKNSLRKLARTCGFLLAGLGLLFFVTPSANADEQNVPEAEVTISGKLDADGTLSVVQKIRFTTGLPKEINQHIAVREDAGKIDNADFVYQVSAITADISGNQVSAEVETGSREVKINVDTSQMKSSDEVTVSYQVKGAVHRNQKIAGYEERVSVWWPVVQGFDFNIAALKGTLAVPGTTKRIECNAGPRGGLTPCEMWQSATHDYPMPFFSQREVNAGEIVLVDFDLPADTVAVNEKILEHWTLDRALTASGAPLYVALVALLVGGVTVALIYRRASRDMVGSGKPTIVARFAPVADGESTFELFEDVRPGEIGTVADERVDPIDVTATILDLAVRGHLKIVELERKTSFGPMDWQFERQTTSPDELRNYERTLLDAIAPISGQGFKVSEMGEPIAEVIPEVQSQLYDEIVKKEWFAHRPDTVRNVWRIAAWISVALTSALFLILLAFTKFGLLGLVLVGTSFGVLWASQEMPRRTEKGSDLLAGLQILSMQLSVQPIDQIPEGREYQELSTILPYAVVLGGTDRWSKAFEIADQEDLPDNDDLSWYKAPEGWHMSNFPASIDAFIAAVEGRLYRR